MSEPTKCDVCGTEAQRSWLAGFPMADGGTGYVHTNQTLCLSLLLAEVPESGADDPPTEFGAARLRMDRLADLTGRERPRVMVVRHPESGLWHWTDADD